MTATFSQQNTLSGGQSKCLFEMSDLLACGWMISAIRYILSSKHTNCRTIKMSVRIVAQSKCRNEISDRLTCGWMISALCDSLIISAKTSLDQVEEWLRPRNNRGNANSSLTLNLKIKIGKKLNQRLRWKTQSREVMGSNPFWPRILDRL